MKMRTLFYTANNRILLCFFILSLIGCKNKNREKFDDKLINKISQENRQLPSKFSFVPFFSNCSNQKVALVYVKDLESIHNLKYKKLSYLDFLKKALNQEINIEYQNKIECFDLDNEVKFNYEKFDFDAFLKLYTDKTVSGKLALKSLINPNQRNTIFYYLFINNYLVSHDDYIGKYNVQKTSDFYNL